MSASEPQPSAREELREQLLQAARRDDARRAAELPARRRGSRRTLALVLALVLGAGAAAGAAELISSGEPVPKSTFSGSDYAPAAPGDPQLAVKAADPSGGPGWGVGTYTAANGNACAIAGQVRGVQVGEVRDGAFHPYRRGSHGTCGDLGKLGLFYDVLNVDGVSLVYGRTGDPNRIVSVTNEGRPYPARPGRDGAFLLVFKGRLTPGDVKPRQGAVIKR